MKKIFCFVAAVFMATASHAQFNNGIFATTTGQGMSDLDVGKLAIKTADGNILLVGNYVNSSGYDPVQVIKTDSTGAVLWQHYYDYNAYWVPFAVTQLTGGNYIISGSVSGGTFGSNNDAFFICIDNSGTLQWTKWFSASYGAITVKETSDGGFVTAWRAVTSGSTMIVKFNSSGTVQWNNAYNVGNGQNPTCIVQTSAGGYALSGDLQGPAGYFLLTFNSSGTLSWGRKIALSSSNTSRSLLQNSSGDFIIGGDMSMSINSTGSTVNWALSGCTITEQTTDGNYLAFANATNNSTYANGGLFKINSSGSATPFWADLYPNVLLSHVFQFASSTFIMVGDANPYPVLGWGVSYNDGIYEAKVYNGNNCAAQTSTFALSSVTGLTTSALSLTGSSPALTANSITLTTTTPAYTVIGRCPCTANAGPNKTNYTNCCPPGPCTSVQIGTSAISGDSYSWLPSSTLSCNTCAQPNATPCNTVTPTVYTVTVTGSCITNTSTVQVTTLKYTGPSCCKVAGVAGNTEKSVFCLFPNPASQQLTVKLNDKADYILIMDVSGKTVYTAKNIEASESVVDISKYSKGIYFVTVKIGDAIEKQKLLVE